MSPLAGLYHAPHVTTSAVGSSMCPTPPPFVVNPTSVFVTCTPEEDPSYWDEVTSEFMCSWYEGGEEILGERGDDIASCDAHEFPQSESLFTLNVPLNTYSHNNTPLSYHCSSQLSLEPCHNTSYPPSSAMNSHAFHATPFARAALAVSQILSKANSKYVWCSICTNIIYHVVCVR
jgi:hypothetical protein